MAVKNIFLILIIFNFGLCFEVQKPRVYDDQNISGWVMSEKLDGIRGYWTGKALYSKNGNKINTPSWFTKNFPPFALDGELWSKRDDFEFIQNTVLDKIPSQNWGRITYNIFEVPNSSGNFLQRLDKAKQWFATHTNTKVKIIPQIICNDDNQLQKYLDKIILLKGEGVIVKDPTQNYHTGRSSFILKVKRALDMEGIVIGYNYKKNSDMLKSLRLKLTNGVVFNLGGGLNDVLRQNPPKLGDMITFKYYGFTKNGIPKFASFIRIRKKE